MAALNGRIKKIGVALAGGGARGFAHVGVLKALEKAGIPVHLVVGTSMGAIVGALYAQLKSAKAVADRLQLVQKEQESNARDLNVYPENQKGDHFLDHVAEEIKQRIIINLSISRKSLLPATRIERAVSSLIEDGPIEDLPIEFAAMASDLRTGKGVVLRRGSLRKAVMASASIPGFFPPVKWDQCLLVDGEATDLIPVEACIALGADFVIAVDIRRDLQPMAELRHTIDVFMRTARITSYRYAEVALSKADFVFRPIAEDVQWSEFDRLNELIAAGEWEARAKLPELQQAMQNAKHHQRRRTDRDFARTHIDLLAIPSFEE